jgi:hypothetical protein
MPDDFTRQGRESGATQWVDFMMTVNFTKHACMRISSIVWHLDGIATVTDFLCFNIIE